jgi:hypothetical protein
LVSVPSMLLGLTSTSAAGYTLNKTLQNSQPRITSVNPSTIAPEVKLTIAGINLFPDGSSDSVDVSVAGSATTGTRGPGDSVLATAPNVLSSTDHTIVVTTAASIATDPFQINVQSSPMILGWKTLPQAGHTCTIIVSGLPGSPEQHQFYVKVAAAAPVEADVSGTDVSFTLDAQASGTVTVTLIVDGIAGQPVQLVIP